MIQQNMDDAVSAESIAFFYPSSQIKTFHPRSVGQWGGYVGAFWAVVVGEGLGEGRVI